MTKKPCQCTVIIIGLIVIGVFVVGCKDKDNKHTERSAELPYPDLKRLAEHSDAPDALTDILRLGDLGGTEAIPVLEKVLADNIDSTNIHGFAAGQALFCIGTPQAHEILSEYLLTDRYNPRLGIDYMFNWDMDESKRNKFIDMYHLKNLSENISINLDVETNDEKKYQQLDFTITLINMSDNTFQFSDRQAYQGLMLYFRSKDGRHVRSFQTAKYQIMMKWIKLKAGEIQTYNIPVQIKRVNRKLKARYTWLSKSARLVADTSDTAYDIATAGEFEVFAMIDEQPMTKELLEHFGLDNTWSGRAVSKPVTVKIGKD